MNTYAELYGNIKKEPFKYGSGNKMISEADIQSRATEIAVSAFGVNKFAKEGDTMSKFMEVVSPVNRLSDTITSAFELPEVKFAGLATGI